VIGSALKVALALVIGLPLVVYLLQERLLFFPQPLDPFRHADIRKRFPAVEELFLESGSRKLHAWYLKAGEGAPLILYFGGNAEEVSWMIEESARLPGASWLLMDYRGYGLSEGAPGEAALVADALAWYDKVVERGQRVFVFGRSLGSGVAVQLAAARPVQAVILAAPYDSIAAVANRHYWYLPVDLLLKHRFDSIGRAPAMKQPLLCLIAEDDEVIPPEHALRLFDAWGGPKQKLVLQSAGHSSIDAHPLFWPAVREFVAQQVH